MDFTLSKYHELIQAFLDSGYTILTFEEYCTLSIMPDKYVVLRHDIDKQPKQALRVAQLEHEMGVHATYYFRIVKPSFVPDIIRAVSALGMEIGYHYEDMSLCKGDAVAAKKHFEESLAALRSLAPIRTVCMHGAPMCHIDNKSLWQYADYHDYGIVGEPYFETDFALVFYLTDTGRRWDGSRYSFVDKVPMQQARWERNGWVYHTTDDILKALHEGSFPNQVLITTHPQRWHNEPLAWLYEYLRQNIVNVVKHILFH